MKKLAKCISALPPHQVLLQFGRKKNICLASSFRDLPCLVLVVVDIFVAVVVAAGDASLFPLHLPCGWFVFYRFSFPLMFSANM